MNTRFVITALLGATLFATVAHGAVRHVSGGEVRGTDLPDGSAVFRSVPYAASPLGALRWQPPQPVIPWHGIREVSAAGNPCMQLDEGWNAKDAAAGAEDCLYLAIHEPGHKSLGHKSNEKLPVFVWIHGGSNRAGAAYETADSPLYKHGIVVVSINYRLGIFGFLAAPELSTESPHHSSGNYALLDQIAALQWVQKNIAAFGGDPHNVTIAGQSAGAMDVGQLLRSPLAVGLFNKAIQESGVMGPPRSAADNEKIGSDLLALLHIPPGATAMKQLRNLPAGELLKVSMKLKPPGGNHDLLWGETSADGWVIPVGNNDIYNSGSLSHVAHIIGNNTQEFVFDGSADAVRGMIHNFYGKNADAALKLYGFTATNPPKDDPVLGKIGTQVLTDVIFRCPEYPLATREMAAHQKVWRYEFGLPRPGHPRVEHNAELDYVFNKAPANATLQTWPPLQTYWANFVKFGDPNGAGLPHWPDMGSDANYIEFLPTGIHYGKNLHGNVCSLLNGK